MYLSSSECTIAFMEQPNGLLNLIFTFPLWKSFKELFTEMEVMKSSVSLPACPDIVMARRLLVTPLVPELLGDDLAKGGLLPGTFTVVFSNRISLPWMSSM